MIRAVIFDLDNTLTDFMRVKEEGIEAAADAMIDAGLDALLPADLGETPRERVIRRIREVYAREGIEYQKVFNTFLQEELGEVDYKLLAAAIVGYRRARDSALVPYPHVHLTLHQLVRRGLKLAVLSDAPRESAWLRLVALNLHHLFDEVITFEDTGMRKPDSAPFRAVLAGLRVAPEEALMVGDWPDRDMAGAAALGMRTVFAHYGYSWSKDKSPIELHPADFEIHDILDLVAIVDRLNGDRNPEAEPEPAGERRPHGRG
jgi:putative hydrolase of the HAD superfamily